MSAFVCSDEHIKQLAIFAAKRGQWRSRNVEPGYVVKGEYGDRLHLLEDHDLASAYANMLYAENIKSVDHRYPDCGPGNRPGPIEQVDVIKVTSREMHNDRVRLAPVAILKMCDCLEYQSCETEDYRESTAYKLLDMIRGAAINALPGYEDAPWEYTGPESIATAMLTDHN